MTDKPPVELTLIGDTAVPATQPPDVTAEPSAVRRFIRDRRRSHASTPAELAKLVEFGMLDLYFDPKAGPEQKLATLRELAKFPALGLTSHNKSVLPPPAWEPAPETADVLERL